MSQNELSYVSPEGHTVFTSKFLKNRGTCCKSACTHCPYGYTLKKLGLQFQEVTVADFPTIDLINSETNTNLEWKSFLPGHVQLMLLKGQVCGYMLKTTLVVKHVVLKPHFQHQGLSKEIIESYFYI